LGSNSKKWGFTVIIKSKFEIPKKDENLIYVPKLVGLFEETDTACITVKAMSGFGKTTVFANLASGCRYLFRWYALDATDNDTDCFLECLERIWQTVDGGGRVPDIPSERTAGVRLQALAYRAQNWDCGRIYLIMDNLQVISSEEVMQLLFLLQHYVENQVTFIFLTNGEVPEGFLQLLLKGKAVFLSEDGLRFTPEEVLRYFGGTCGLSGAVLSQVTKGLCGWPLGVKEVLEYLQEEKRKVPCCLSAMQEMGAPSLVTGAWIKILQESFLSRYLDKVLWEKCPTEIRFLLKQTAALDEFSWEICQTVLSGKITRQTFERMISGCGFLCKVNGKADTYRYGEAFRAYLCRMLSGDEKEEAGNLFNGGAAEGCGNILKVRTFGAFQVTAAGDGKELAWRTKKGRELFAYLLDIEGKAVGRRELIEVLWQDEIPEKAVALLHNMIYNIRKELSAYGLGLILTYERKRYRLNMEGIACDFYHIRKVVGLVEEGNVSRLMMEYKSFLVYWGSYLEDIDSFWAEAKRGYYDEMYKKGCFLLAEQFTKENKRETAIKLYQNILLVEPYSEKAVEKMLLLYGEQREWEKVQRCYKEFKETLERDLGIVPGEEVLGAYHHFLSE